MGSRRGKLKITEFESTARRRIQEGIRIKEQLLEDRYVRILANVARAIVDAYQKRNKVVLFGNGGSAADAQHLAAEFVGKYYLNREGLPAIALTANNSSLTAIGNDYGFDRIFARQLQALGNPGDVAIGISTSGRSRNVLTALEVAKGKGMTTVGLTGRDASQMMTLVDFCVPVPSDDTPRIQEAHILIGHILCELVEGAIFGE